MMKVTLAIAASIAALKVVDAGVCQDTAFPECISLGCSSTRQGNGCAQPAACTSGGNSRIFYNGAQTGVQVNRAPIPPSVAILCDTDTECSARYTVYLDRKWVTGMPCNDIAMLPPHGRDQRVCQTMEADIEPAGQMFSGVTLGDYRNHPYPDDGIKQSLALAKGSVTALTEESVNCALSATTGNQNCAFPLGFKSDTIMKNLGVCVRVVGAQDKWVEILASSKEGSSGGSFCVRNRFTGANVEEGEKGCTVQGDLIDIRESGNRPQVNNNNADQMEIVFYAQDNMDDAAIDIYWRVAASYIRPTNREAPGEQKDAEDWSMTRDGAGYPASLMRPYPANYNGTPVFEGLETSSASHVAPAPLMQLIIVLVAIVAIVGAGAGYSLM